MENSNTFVDVNSSSSFLNHSKFIDHIEEFVIDWTNFYPISFGTPSPDLNSSPVIPVEMTQFVPPSPPPPPSPPRNQTMNIENGFNPTSFYISCPNPDLILKSQVEIPRFDPTKNMMFATPWIATSPLSTPSPPCNQMVNGENNGFNPTSFVMPCRDSNPTLERQVEMSQFDSTENMMFAMPWIATSPLSSSSPPRNETMNGENNGFNSSSFVNPCPDPNPTRERQVEMSRFDPIEKMMIENPWSEMQSSSPLPFNQTMNLENNLNPTPFFNPILDMNPTFVRPVEMHAFNPIENIVFENKWTEMTSSFPPCNQTTNTKNLDFSPFRHGYQTNADIICENHLRAYRSDSSSIRTAVDRGCPAVSLSSTQFPPPCNEVKAATHGTADSSTFKRKWSIQEHKLLLVGMEIFGKGDWTNIADKVVITKSNTQVSSHAQKYFFRLTLPIEKKEKRSSIHNITEFEPELLSMVRARLGLPSSSSPPSNE